MKPIVMVGCDSIKIGPYNTNYPLIEKHMISCGLYPKMINKFAKPIQLTSMATNNQWFLIHPQNFTLFTIPIESINRGAMPKINFQSLIAKNYTVFCPNVEVSFFPAESFQKNYSFS
jgi:hypothetical protein